MKKILSVLLMIILCTSAISAQEGKGFFVGVDAGQRATSLLSKKVVLYPSIGYQINSDWSLGIRSQIDFSDIDFSYLVGYVQYNFVKFNKVSLFSEGKISVFYPIPGKKDDMAKVTEVGINFGVSYEFLKKLKLNLRYLYIGYCSNPHWDQNGSYILEEDKFIVSGSIPRLQVGLQYTF